MRLSKKALAHILLRVPGDIAFSLHCLQYNIFAISRIEEVKPK
jgi:hypothetical protein